VEDAQKALEDALDPELAQAEALQAIADAQKAVEQAEINLANANSAANQSFIDEAAANVVLAKEKLDKAKENYLPYANKPEDNLTRAALLSAYAAAQQQFDAAVRQLNSLQGTASSTDIAVLQSELATAQAQLVEAQQEYERVKDGPSEGEVAALKAQLADAQREWERLKGGPAPEDLAAAEARVAAAEATLNQAHLTAPFDGVITRILNKPGDQAAPGSPALRLDDLSRLLVDVEVSEVDINQIQMSQPALLTFDSILGKEYHGQVVEVASVGEEVQGVVNFGITVELTDADEQVKPGMTASVTITVSELSGVLLIPNQAVRTVDGERVVYVLRGGVQAPVPVTLGRSSDTSSELLEGDLQEGDPIVLNPQAEFPFGPDSQGGGNGGNGPFGGGSP
jgi:HlyD family secretion protein